ncbi:sugar phosphate isomerase/epimerase family protein [Parapedobacter sp. 10938]|uniref:sugar phosphate isomerase/epimerase family protein n=1 Tax=Parapedobacter flavus TaxID=3110225 RepID=UPI002DBBDFBC|nr:sugar phosphate isomerase/epimerase family protein [Parapedobacter sp. 10938]MEC3880927.1 sugar phosphate isomerase/epimerase family protein [Parapedobacter sp. 10938]
MMDRKNFIKSASLLAGGAVVAPALGGASPLMAKPVGNTLKLKKGVSFYMIKEELSLVDKCKLVKDLGFDGVEFNSPVDFSLDEMLEAKEKAGIEIPSVVNKDHWSKPLSDPDPEVRQFTIDSVAKSLADVKALGGDTVLVVPGVVNEKIPYGVAYRNALDSVRKLIPHAEKTGMKIGLENVWSNFILSPVEARQFVDEINHPLVGWYFDIGNILRYGWPEHWITELNRRIVKLHAKEFSREKMNDEGLWDGFKVDLLAGDNNWPVVMQALRDIDYQGGWLTVELGGGDREYLKKVSGQMDAIFAL